MQHSRRRLRQQINKSLNCSHGHDTAALVITKACQKWESSRQDTVQASLRLSFRLEWQLATPLLLMRHTSLGALHARSLHLSTQAAALFCTHSRPADGNSW